METDLNVNIQTNKQKWPKEFKAMMLFEKKKNGIQDENNEEK